MDSRHSTQNLRRMIDSARYPIHFHVSLRRRSVYNAYVSCLHLKQNTSYAGLHPRKKGKRCAGLRRRADSMNLSLPDLQEWINHNRQEIIDDLFGLVRIPSISDPSSPVRPFGQPCQDALAYMYALAARHGLSSDDFSHTVGRIRLTRREHARSIGIWCHLDVVPVPNPEDWVYPPFEGTEVDHRYLIGRGIQDNKMPAIAVFHVFRYLREKGIELNRDWSLYLGTSEENGMDDVRWFVRNCACPDLSLVPDTGFPVCTAQRGSQVLRFSIPLDPGTSLAFRCGSNISVTPETVTAEFGDGRVLRSQGHGFHIIRADHDNAVLHMLEQLSSALPGYAESLTGLRALLDSEESMGIAYSDEASGPVFARPTQMSFENGRLLVDVFSVIPVTGNPDALLASAQAKAGASGIDCKRRSMRPPCYFRSDHPLVRVLTDVYHDVTGDPAGPFIMTGGNYASLLPNALGYGPGMPGRLFPESIFPQGHGDYHQCDESEDWEHIVSFMKVYAEAVMRLDSTDKL